MDKSPRPAQHDRLDSWKEIAVISAVPKGPFGAGKKERDCLYTGSCTRRTPMRFSGIAKASKVAILVLFPAAVNPLHFVPHIRAPKFLLNRLFLLMREPRNRVSFIGTAIFRRPKSPFR
jgi:hypothetical protein